MLEFIEKQHLKSYLTVQPEFFLKSSLPVSIFCMFVNKLARTSQKVNRVIMRNISVLFFLEDEDVIDVQPCSY